ncbi:MAG TPA: hypothetical protein VGC21_00455 [Telluria sp.]|jgi:hypothetical protein
MSAPVMHWPRVGRAALDGESARSLFWVSALFLMIALVFFAAGWLIGPDGFRTGCQLGGAVLAFTAAWWWAAFISGAARQNSPANARLVPGLNRAVRQAVIAGWLATMTLMLPLAYGHPDGALLLPLLGLAISSLGLTLAGREDGSVVFTAVGLLYVFASVSDGLAAHLQRPAVLALLTLACLGYAAWALWHAFPAAGERHWDMRYKQRRLVAMLDLAEWDRFTRGNAGRNSLFARVLARDLRRSARPADMLLHGVGPRNHRFHLLGVMAGWAALLLCVRPLMVVLGLPVEDAIRAVGQPVTGGIIAGMLICWARVPLSIRSTPNEQAVLRLVPGLPGGRQFNQVLGRRIVEICLREWVATLALVMLLLWQWDANSGQWRIMAVVSAGLLAGVGTALDDFARKPQGPTWPTVLLVGWMLLIAALGIVLRADNAIWLVALALMTGTSLAFLSVRWRRMQRGAVAFPAGRMH